MSVGVGSICFACQHWQGNVCAAFPGGIPREVLLGGRDHRIPVGGEVEDAGGPILFVLRDGREDDLAMYVELKNLS